MRVIAWTMHPERYPGVEFVELDELYRASDVVSVHLRLSAETEGFVGAAQFAMMKTSAILINTARGAIVQRRRRWEALTTGPHRGAGLDVFAIEPLPAAASADTVGQRGADAALRGHHSGSAGSRAADGGGEYLGLSGGANSNRVG